MRNAIVNRKQILINTYLRDAQKLFVLSVKTSYISVWGFCCVPSMALTLLVKVQSRVFTAKCSEPQVGISNGMDEGSGVAKFLSLRTET